LSSNVSSKKKPRKRTRVKKRLESEKNCKLVWVWQIGTGVVGLTSTRERKDWPKIPADCTPVNPAYSKRGRRFREMGCVNAGRIIFIIGRDVGFGVACASKKPIVGYPEKAPLLSPLQREFCLSKGWRVVGKSKVVRQNHHRLGVAKKNTQTCPSIQRTTWSSNTERKIKPRIKRSHDPESQGERNHIPKHRTA